jgi:hypothetical protein
MVTTWPPKYPEYLRHIRLKDPKSGKTLIVLTNSTTLPALRIAAPDKVAGRSISVCEKTLVPCALQPNLSPSMPQTTANFVQILTGRSE